MANISRLHLLNNFPSLQRANHQTTRAHLRHLRTSSAISQPGSGLQAVDQWSIPVKLRGPNRVTGLQPATLSDDELIRLHRLAALEPPRHGTPEFLKAKNDLQSMLAMVDSVKDFEPAINEDFSEPIPDGRIWPTGESLPIDWESIVQDQIDFIQARSNHVPGATKRDLSDHHEANSMSPPHPDSKSNIALNMAIEGIHTVRRRGIGQRPQNENVFYVVKQAPVARRKETQAEQVD